MLRIVAEMDMDLETFTRLHIPDNNVCPFVTAEECGNESYCRACSLKYENRIPRIISIDNISAEKI